MLFADVKSSGRLLEGASRHHVSRREHAGREIEVPAIEARPAAVRGAPAAAQQPPGLREVRSALVNVLRRRFLAR